MEGKKDKKVCIYFNQGNCTKGSQCQYLHQKAQKGNEKHKGDTTDKRVYYRNQNTNPLEDKEIEENIKIYKYLTELHDSLKTKCFSCKSADFLVLLSCGCQSLCEDCAKQNKNCCLPGHKYLKKYIK